MSCRIQPVSGAMAGTLSLLHTSCFSEDPWDVQTIAGIMKMAGFFGRIAWKKGQPIGFVLALDLGAEWEIVSLGVLPERRRSGCGSALLASACREALLRRSRSVVLEVAEDNIAARALYAARGFTSVGRRPNYYRQVRRFVDALVLRLELAGS